MTHLRTERTRARTPFTAVALVMPAASGEASAAARTQPVAHHGGGPPGTPHGFASPARGTTGGRGGEVVTVTDRAGPERYAGAQRPHVIRVAGSVAVEPFGADIDVTSDKTIREDSQYTAAPHRTHH
ncbi:hypothetical protein [Streptomyces sp. HB132]|uniref:hypothetical protein n=1 Tax=Streptomyces sp. HB132 TaxID=767388 RepID=UPI001960681D|nr:hypothetical protein [Streptomyces sp. HB132]MBM7438249.1 pectate lyase [Streptomyces sp. HB132]